MRTAATGFGLGLAVGWALLSPGSSCPRVGETITKVCVVHPSDHKAPVWLDTDPGH